MTESPYEGATPEQLQHPLVQHFLDVHNMFRNEMAAMLNFVNELLAGQQALSGPETRAHIRTLTQAGIQYTQMLHHHHHGESSMLFPVLAAEGVQPEVVKHLEDEHDDIAGLIDQFEGALRDYAAVEPAVLNDDLRRLSKALHDHLAYEETYVCPVLARFNNWPLQ